MTEFWRAKTAELTSCKVGRCFFDFRMVFKVADVGVKNFLSAAKIVNSEGEGVPEHATCDSEICIGSSDVLGVLLGEPVGEVDVAILP